jgi:hypothetical protein
LSPTRTEPTTLLVHAIWCTLTLNRCVASSALLTRGYGAIV